MNEYIEPTYEMKKPERIGPGHLVNSPIEISKKPQQEDFNASLDVANEEYIDNIKNLESLKELQSKGNFDRVTEIKKPESVNPGLETKTLDSALESGKMKTKNTFTLPDTPNLYKHIGVSMENLGYFAFPRSILADSRYLAARLKYKHVLHVLFANAAFAPTTHSIGTETIPIAIGQFCVSERNLVDLCNDGVRFKEDKVDKNIVHRAVQFWARCLYLRQEVIHEKNLITITIPDFYKKEKTQSEPGSEPKVNHNRTSKEEDKEDKEDNNIYSSVAVAPSEKKKVSSSSSKKRKKAEPAPLIERDKGVFTSDIAHQKLIQEKGSEEIVKQIYSAMAVWKAQNGIEGGDDYRTALRWSLSPNKPAMSHKKPEQAPSRHNNPNFKPKDQRPLAFNNKLSFNTPEKNQ